jgi:hypothetical protein
MLSRVSLIYNRAIHMKPGINGAALEGHVVIGPDFVPAFSAHLLVDRNAVILPHKEFQITGEET